MPQISYSTVITWKRSCLVTYKESPMALTSEQYINALPLSGLELAEAFLEDDLETLQANDLPVNDTVASLLTVRARRTEQETDEDNL